MFSLVLTAEFAVMKILLVWSEHDYLDTFTFNLNMSALGILQPVLVTVFLNVLVIVRIPFRIPLTVLVDLFLVL